jgi:hypothetical protein
MAVANTQQVSCKNALLLLASSEGKAGTSIDLKYKAIHAHCKLCNAHWLVKTSVPGQILHTCPTVRAATLPLYAAHLKQKQSEAEDALVYASEEDVQLAASVTRSLNAGVHCWSVGSSISSSDDEIWDSSKPRAPPRAKRSASSTDPAYEQIMDDRLRLRGPKLDLEEFIYPYQLLQSPRFAGELLDPSTRLPAPIDGLTFARLPSFFEQNRTVMENQPYCMLLEEVSNAPSSTFIVTSARDHMQQAEIWSYRQAAAAATQTKPKVKRGSISMIQVEAAVLDRISIGRCRPLFYDAVNDIDKLLQQKTQAVAASSDQPQVEQRKAKQQAGFTASTADKKSSSKPSIPSRSPPRQPMTLLRVPPSPSRPKRTLPPDPDGLLAELGPIPPAWRMYYQTGQPAFKKSKR